jgi:hypothetical protein
MPLLGIEAYDSQYHPKARRFRNRPMPHVELCTELYGNNIATGKRARHPTLRNDPFLDPDVLQDPVPLFAPTTPSTQVSTSSSSIFGEEERSARRRKGNKGDQLLTSIDRLATAYEERSETAANRALRLLWREFANREREWRLRASKALTTEKNAEIFIAVPEEEREEVLELMILELQ